MASFLKMRKVILLTDVHSVYRALFFNKNNPLQKPYAFIQTPELSAGSAMNHTRSIFAGHHGFVHRQKILPWCRLVNHMRGENQPPVPAHGLEQVPDMAAHIVRRAVAQRARVIHTTEAGELAVIKPFEFRHVVALHLHGVHRINAQLHQTGQDLRQIAVGMIQNRQILAFGQLYTLLHAGEQELIQRFR